MKKLILSYIVCLYFLVYMSYINKPLTELEVYCNNFYENIYDETITEPLMLIIKGTCDGKT